MPNSKKTKFVPKEQLKPISSLLSEQYPLLYRIKVKPYYDRVQIRARVGKRIIFVRGTLKTVVAKFHVQYAERYQATL